MGLSNLKEDDVNEKIAELVCELMHSEFLGEVEKKAKVRELLSLLPSEIDGIAIDEQYFPKEEKNYLTLDELSEQYNC